MSTGLRVSVALSLHESDLPHGAKVVGDIYPADGTGSAHRDVLFPCGTSAPSARYEVEPGRYLVSATLPSGIVLSKDAEVSEGRDTHVTLRTAPSPYDSHSWQYLMGNIESYGDYHDDETIEVPRSQGSRSGVWATGGVVAPGSAVWVGDPKPDSWHFPTMLALTDGPSPEPIALDLAHSAPHTVPSLDLGDAAARLYRFGPHGPVDEQGEPALQGPTGRRQFLVVSLTGAEYVVTLPAPWGDAQIEVMVNERQSPTGSTVSVTVRDSRVGPALGYMARGAFDTAAALVKDAEDMLYAKMENPLAAVAGAYILVGSELTERRHRWDDWLDHLRREFPWLSDGSLLWGMRHLRRAHTETELSEARHALVEAFDRGVPVFTLGLSRLIHGLSEFPGDPECATRLDQARLLSYRVDMREPFVIVGLRGVPQ
ncbi:hypothetical protein ACOT81_40875 [Streptomyces sp. WI04-05B]|uniref:hypothetical protein n=1 Tax=Streptomyces TaxID=1883 RepID=UPI0029AB3548|nr:MULTISPECIES: hypothetical protein [unclassified Streptomyces]MDX2547946.1 hypothetical protein [Streptomyces sp. WI04-05B]MDX2582807.1 hypothetical protein [Streptomyces sp. WI04-05A]